MPSELICFCGAILVPVDGFWVCTRKGSIAVAMEPGKIHHGHQVEDKRQGLCPRPLLPKVGKPGPPGSRSRGRGRVKVHAGPLAACRVCSPATAEFVIAQLKKLKKRMEERNAR